jgi:hypothetical protein
MIEFPGYIYVRGMVYYRLTQPGLNLRGLMQ